MNGERTAPLGLISPNHVEKLIVPLKVVMLVAVPVANDPLVTNHRFPAPSSTAESIRRPFNETGFPGVKSENDGGVIVGIVEEDASQNDSVPPSVIAPAPVSEYPHTCPVTLSYASELVVACPEVEVVAKHPGLDDAVAATLPAEFTLTMLSEPEAHAFPEPSGAPEPTTEPPSVVHAVSLAGVITDPLEFISK